MTAAGRATQPRLGVVGVPDAACHACGAAAVGRVASPDVAYCGEHHGAAVVAWREAVAELDADAWRERVAAGRVVPAGEVVRAARTGAT